MKRLLAAVMIAAAFVAAPAPALADPVVGDACSFEDGVTGDVVAGVLRLDEESGQVYCYSADGRSSWGRSSWGR
jgi:hypothetical protein